MSTQDPKTTKETHAAVTTHDELDLSRSEAFDHFLESAEDVYVDAARYRGIAQAEGYRSLQFDDVKGEEIFTTLYVILRELQAIVVREKERLLAGKTPVSGQSVLRMQKLYDDMLLLRNVVISTYESLQRSKKEKEVRIEQEAVAGEKTRQQSEQIPQIRTEPEITELRERIDRIIRRVTAGAPFASEVLQNTRTLAQMFRTIDSDPQSTYEQKLSAYNDLSVYVLDHEKEWLTVCGMPVPLPGSKGVATARALREVLLVERDRHTELVRDPRKQLAVDKLIRKLSAISPGGLSAEVDIPEVMSLMRMIDVQGQQGRLANPAGESLMVECFDAPEEELMIKGLGSQDPTHKVMNITVEDTEIPIAIAVAGKAREQIIQQTPVSKPTPVLPIPEGELAAKKDGSVIAKVEKFDPINRAIPNVPSSRVAPARPVHEKRSLTKLYLSAPSYQEFIATHYSSPAAFERLLDTTVTQIEAKTVDVFERWLQEEKVSPFVYLEEMTVGEVLQLGANRQARSLLLEQNIKYETFLAWLDLIPEMQSVVGTDKHLKFGALFARWMIETDMAYAAAVS